MAAPRLLLAAAAATSTRALPEEQLHNPLRCTSTAECTSKMPPCPKAPPGFPLFQQQPLCLIERGRGPPGRGPPPPGPVSGVCICQVPKFNCPTPGPQAAAPIEQVTMVMLHPPVRPTTPAQPQPNPTAVA